MSAHNAKDGQRPHNQENDDCDDFNRRHPELRFTKRADRHGIN